MKIEISELPTYEKDGRLYLDEDHTATEGFIWKAYLSQLTKDKRILYAGIAKVSGIDLFFSPEAHRYSIELPKPEPVYEDGDWVMIKTEEQLREVAVKTASGDYYPKIFPENEYLGNDFSTGMLQGDDAIAGKAVKLTGSESLRAGRWSIEPWMISHKLPCRPSWVEDDYQYWDGVDPEYVKQEGDEWTYSDEGLSWIPVNVDKSNIPTAIYRRKIVKPKTWRPYESINEVDLDAYYKMKFSTEWLTESGINLENGAIKIGCLWVHYTDLFDNWRTSKDPRTEPITPCGVEVEG